MTPTPVTGDHIEAADAAMYELPLDTTTPAEELRDAIAQLIADAEARGAARAVAASLRAAAVRYRAEEAHAQQTVNTDGWALARRRAAACEEAARIIEETPTP